MTKPSFTGTLGERLQIPGEALGELKLSVLGDHRALIENHRGLLHCSEDLLAVRGMHMSLCLWRGASDRGHERQRSAALRPSGPGGMGGVRRLMEESGKSPGNGGGGALRTGAGGTVGALPRRWPAALERLPGGRLHAAYRTLERDLRPWSRLRQRSGLSPGVLELRAAVGIKKASAPEMGCFWALRLPSCCCSPPRFRVADRGDRLRERLHRQMLRRWRPAGVEPGAFRPGHRSGTGEKPGPDSASGAGVAHGEYIRLPCCGAGAGAGGEPELLSEQAPENWGAGRSGIVRNVTVLSGQSLVEPGTRCWRGAPDQRRAGEPVGRHSAGARPGRSAGGDLVRDQLDLPAGNAADQGKERGGGLVLPADRKKSLHSLAFFPKRP